MAQRNLQPQLEIGCFGKFFRLVQHKCKQLARQCKVWCSPQAPPNSPKKFFKSFSRPAKMPRNHRNITAIPGRTPFAGSVREKHQVELRQTRTGTPPRLKSPLSDQCFLVFLVLVRDLREQLTGHSVAQKSPLEGQSHVSFRVRFSLRIQSIRLNQSLRN